MERNILLVEDMDEIREVVSKYIEKEGYKAFQARDGFMALELFSEEEIHLVILDVMMPGIDGFEVLSEIRKISEVPVILLTAKGEEGDRIKGFDLGADDYVAKPFSSRELMRRVKAILKRVYNDKEEVCLKCMGLELYKNSQKLFKDGVEIEITASEFNLLNIFFNNKNQILTREQIINKAYGYNYEGETRNIDTYIKRIRQKIEENPKNPQILRTKYGAGYIFGGSE